MIFPPKLFFPSSLFREGKRIRIYELRPAESFMGFVPKIVRPRQVRLAAAAAAAAPSPSSFACVAVFPPPSLPRHTALRLEIWDFPFSIFFQESKYSYLT
jgi:hypothetical protein